MGNEANLESYFKLQIEKLGGLCLKFVSPQYSGVPDRIVIVEGFVYFVELKAPGHVLKPRQELVHFEFKKRGVIVYTVDGLVSLAYFINKVKTDISKLK